MSVTFQRGQVMAGLYLVSTPIGNLEDVTARAARVLAESDRILAEDTRRSRVLLDHLGVRAPLVSLHEHNEASRIDAVLGWLGAGERVALVSDAGTPLVSDPGGRLVSAVAEAGFPVVPVPGPSAVLAALVASGLPTEPFVFLGFLPRKGRARRDVLERVAEGWATAVLFESPRRLDRTLGHLVLACGPDRPVAVAREVTKLHESFFRGTLAEARAYYEQHPPRGEVTLVIGPAPVPSVADDDVEARAGALARTLLAEGMRSSEAAREVAERLGVAKNLAYRIVHDEDR